MSGAFAFAPLDERASVVMMGAGFAGCAGALISVPGVFRCTEAHCRHDAPEKSGAFSFGACVDGTRAHVAGDDHPRTHHWFCVGRLFMGIRMAYNSHCPSQPTTVKARAVKARH